jgi:hypothetical protein
MDWRTASNKLYEDHPNSEIEMGHKDKHTVACADIIMISRTAFIHLKKVNGCT